MPMPRVRVDGGDDPVRGDPPGDPEHPGLVLLQILTGHASQQRRRLRHPRPKFQPIQRRQQRTGVAGQRINQFIPGRRVVIVTGRLPRGGVVIIAAQYPAQGAGRAAVACT
jgi:hypothetical protein